MSVIALILLGSPLPQVAATPVPDVVLAQQRGGFRLPNGIDVALTVQSVTSVNGAVVLDTTFKVDQGPAVTTVYAPKSGAWVEGSMGDSENVGTGAMSAPTINYDSRGVLQVTPGAVIPKVALTTGGLSATRSMDGLAHVVTDAPVTTDNGTITQTTRDGLRTVMLEGHDLSVTHFGGNAFGSAIANSGSDRTIDTQTIISLDLRNAGPDVLGSAMLRAGNVATDAIALRGQ